MAYMYLGAEVPYRAAIIMEKGMKDGIIRRTAKESRSAWYRLVSSQRAR